MAINDQTRLFAGGTQNFNMAGGSPAYQGDSQSPSGMTTLGNTGQTQHGLISQFQSEQRPPSQNPPVQQAVAQTYDPVTRTVTADETSLGQLQKLFDSDSTLLKRAKAKANAGMQSRGLLNSSMAVGAAEGAMWDAAAPFALNDANTYSRAASENQQAQNTARQFNVGELNQTGRFNVGEVNRRGDLDVSNTAAMDRLKVSESGAMDRLKISESGATARQDSVNATSRANAQLAADTSRYTADVGAATSRANAQLAADVSRYTANLSAETQRSVAQYQVESAALRDDSRMAFEANQRYLDRVQQINMNPDLDGPTRQAMVDNLTAGLMAADQVAAAISGIPLAVR